MTYLLDVNVLLAYHYSAHVFHRRALDWMTSLESRGDLSRFASCSIVDLGFIRIASGKSSLAANVAAARADLRRVKAQLALTLVGDELHGDQLPEWVTKHSQTTDGHLLELAERHKMRFATLDSGNPGAFLIPENFDVPDQVREPVLRYGAARERAGAQFASAPPVPRVDLLSVPANSTGGLPVAATM